MADFAGGQIEAFVGPTELGASDDLEQVIVDFIAGAEESLDVAVQEIDSEPSSHSNRGRAGQRLCPTWLTEHGLDAGNRRRAPR